jgi:hypothetical protein
MIEEMDGGQVAGRRSEHRALVLILILRADPLAVAIVVTTAVVVVVVAIRTCRRGSDGSAGCYAAPRIPSGVTRDGTTGITWATRDRTTGVAWAASDGMARARASSKMMPPSSTTVNTSNVGGTTTEPASAATEAAATTAASSQRIIGDQGRRNEHDGCESDESITKHGTSPGYCGALHPCPLGRNAGVSSTTAPALMNRHPYQRWMLSSSRLEIDQPLGRFNRDKRLPRLSCVRAKGLFAACRISVSGVDPSGRVQAGDRGQEPNHLLSAQEVGAKS